MRHGKRVTLPDAKFDVEWGVDNVLLMSTINRKITLRLGTRMRTTTNDRRRLGWISYLSDTSARRWLSFMVGSHPSFEIECGLPRHAVEPRTQTDGFESARLNELVNLVTANAPGTRQDRRR